MTHRFYGSSSKSLLSMVVEFLNERVYLSVVWLGLDLRTKLRWLLATWNVEEGVWHTSVPLIHPIEKLEYRCVANSSQVTWTRLFWGLYT
jgi:hypothetical protein